MTCDRCGRHSDPDDPRPSLLVLNGLCGACWQQSVPESEPEPLSLLERAHSEARNQPRKPRKPAWGSA